MTREVAEVLMTLSEKRTRTSIDYFCWYICGNKAVKDVLLETPTFFVLTMMCDECINRNKGSEHEISVID